MAPVSVSARASLRPEPPGASASLNNTRSVNAVDPSWAAGTFWNSAVSGTTSPSSLLMVPDAAASVSVAFVGLESVSVKVSSSSPAESSVVSTLTVFDVSFAANVSVPDAAVKSIPLVAVPPEVAYATVTGSLFDRDSDTVNTTAEPSVALASATLSPGSSLLRMVPVAYWSAIVALSASLSVSVKVSPSSSTASSISRTDTVCSVSSRRNVSVPYFSS